MKRLAFSTWGLALILSHMLYLLLFTVIGLSTAHWDITGTGVLLLFMVSFTGGVASLLVFLLLAYLSSILFTAGNNAFHAGIAIAAVTAMFAGLITGSYLISFLTKQNNQQGLYLLRVVKPGHHFSAVLFFSGPPVAGTLGSFFIHHLITKNHEKEDH